MSNTPSSESTATAVDSWPSHQEHIDSDGMENSTDEVDPSNACEQPVVSIIVPVYNDPAGLEDTLTALVSQTYPDAKYEILVVDNDSTDDTMTVAREFESCNEPVSCYRETAIQGSYAARNRGIRHASGDILAFVDADVTMSHSWLATAIKSMQDQDASYMGCPVTMHTGKERTLASQYNFHTGFPIAYFLRELDFAPTCGLFVHRAVIDDVGPFDPRLISSGDREFGQRVVASGRRLHLASDAAISHPTRTSVRALLSKSRRIGRGIYQLRQRHPERYGSRLLAVCNPWPYLPPRRETIRTSVGTTTWDSLTRRERAGYYLLSYATSLANGVGRLEQAARDLLGSLFQTETNSDASIGHFRNV